MIQDSDDVVVTDPLSQQWGIEGNLRTLFETVLDGLIIINSQGIVEAFNPAAEKLFGYGAAEIVGQNISLLMPEPYRERHDTYLQNYARTGIPHIIGTTREIQALRRGGDLFAIELSVSEFRQNGARGYIGVVRDISERKKAEENHKRLLQQLITAEEEVRRCIARDLHDTVGQSLLSLMLELHNAAEETTPVSPQRCHRLFQQTRALLEEVRRLARGLHPSVLDDLGLSAALGRFTDEYARMHALQVDVYLQGVTTHRLPRPLETTLYRIAQEALSNVVKHAHARQVSVLLEQQPTQVQLIIEDDGQGFDVEQTRAESLARGQLGLSNIRERASLFGGTVTVESAPERGTTLYVQIPLTADYHGQDTSPSGR